MSDEKEPKGEVKAEKEPKKEKVVEVKEVILRAAKANSKKSIQPATGTRFEPGSARQLAFDIVVGAIKEGKNAKDIRAILAGTKKDKGAKFSLDAGYLNYIYATHPEMFKVYNNGKVEMIAQPKPDPEAAKKLEEEKVAKKKKAEEAREKRRKEATEKKEKAADGKAEKKDKKDNGEKPSKKEKES
jgi:hypothetical protein